MNKLLAGVAVVSGVFFGRSPFAAAARSETKSAEPAKWQQFCEPAATEALSDLNGRLQQLGEQGWELTSVNANVACFRRPWAKGALPLAAAIAPAKIVLAPVVLPAPIRAPAANAPTPEPVVAAAPVKAVPIKPVTKSAEVALVAPAKPVAASVAKAEAAKETAPAITAAAAEVMAAPSVTKAPAAKPSQAQSEAAPPSRSLIPDSDPPDTPRPRRALVPKS